ncbi:thiamine phosphate synthase [Heliorestis convoluta]|uniref:Thiamine-phosphate synthase n=1 Tax=Heliorestis convoluta TaxID=356322 RepID=A0A5Q2MWZ0_9FIRM|nr:thiamine phosphate synthase [Heliorestis convoluta]QGG47134.1 Thiamine-phosphate pyrophosphorylase [Heliorestis convoluta]
MKKRITDDSPILYGILGQGQASSDEELVDKAKAAFAGGCDIIQLREKNISTSDYYRRASLLRTITAEAGKLLFINDRLDIAMAVEADGVHLGQEDLPLVKARALWPQGLIGVTVRNATTARQAEIDGADYVGAGPVFTPFSKELDVKTLGYEGLRELCAIVNIPVIAIGGLDESNLEGLRGTGARGAAMIAAIFKQENPQEAARTLKSLLY